jgi:uncharacterized protein
MEAIEALADRVMRALDEGDHETVEAAFDPNATWWMNGRRRGTFTEVLPQLRRAKPERTARRHEQIRRLYAPDGFTDQHLTRLPGPNGDIELAICVVVRVEAGRVTRLEEYFDPTQLPG